MTPEDRRSYLGGKIGDKMSEEQIDQIAAAISAKLDGTPAPAAEASSDATDDTDAASDDGDASGKTDDAGDAEEEDTSSDS
jgi:hypothetical protein